MLSRSDEMGVAELGEEMVQMVQSKYIAGLFAVLIEQQSVDNYSDKNQRRMSEQVVASVKKNMHWMSAITKEDLQRALEDVAENLTDKQIIDDYTSLIGAL